MGAAKLQAIAIGAAVLVGGLVLWKAASVGKGLVTGNNALTRDATDAYGNPVSAYQGVPVLGTLGAAANEASGGYLASFGSWLGIKAYDLTHSDPEPEPQRLARPAVPTTGPESVFNGATSWANMAGLDGGDFLFSTQPIPGF
jgi:hypothetical protein